MSEGNKINLYKSMQKITIVTGYAQGNLINNYRYF